MIKVDPFDNKTLAITLEGLARDLTAEGYVVANHVLRIAAERLMRADELNGEVQGIEYTIARIYARQIEECECGGGDCDACRLMAEECRKGRELFDKLKAENAKLREELIERYEFDVCLTHTSGYRCTGECESAQKRIAELREEK